MGDAHHHTSRSGEPGESFERRMQAWARGLANFSGRYGRARFWLGTLGLIGILFLCLLMLVPYMSTTGGKGGEIFVIFILLIPFFYFYMRLLARRLHDFDRSGWWAIPLAAILVALPIVMFNETHDVYRRIEQSHAAQQAIKGYVSALWWGAVLIFFGGWTLLGSLRGTRGANTYGPDPAEPRAR